MGEINNKSLTILMYPWFAMGHLFPMVSTANKLAERGHRIFVIIPPKTRPKLDPLNLYPDHIEYIPMPIPRVEGLRENAETTNDGLTSEEQHLLMHALDLTKPVLQSLLRDLRPDFVFHDMMHWLPGLARDLGIKSVHYCSVGTAAASFLFSDTDGFPQSIQLSKYSARLLKMFGTINRVGSGISVAQRLTTSLYDADAVVFNTCDEIEGEYCRFLEKTIKKPVILAGPVNSTPQSSDEKWGVWLDKFQPKSLIYCAFGSEFVLERDQFEQLLLGIELTSFPFLIALKPPSGVESVEEAFPVGFKQRTGNRGVVHGGWVPQQLILKHTAVGCFVTHCGYGSMWEGLMSECQLVSLPGRLPDQCMQARLLSGILKVGVEVEKGDEDGLFTKEGVHAAIMAAMAKESKIAEEIRENHDRLRKVLLSEGFLNSYFDNFVGSLRALLH